MVDLYRYKKHIPLVLINLTPLNPPLLEKERGKELKRGGRSPLSLIYTPPSPFEGEGGYRGMGLEQQSRVIQYRQLAIVLSTKCRQYLSIHSSCILQTAHVDAKLIM
jgi:hypothetical protein